MKYITILQESNNTELEMLVNDETNGIIRTSIDSRNDFLDETAIPECYEIYIGVDRIAHAKIIETVKKLNVEYITISSNPVLNYLTSVDVCHPTAGLVVKDVCLANMESDMSKAFAQFLENENKITALLEVATEKKKQGGINTLVITVPTEQWVGQSNKELQPGEPIITELATIKTFTACGVHYGLSKNSANINRENAKLVAVCRVDENNAQFGGRAYIWELMFDTVQIDIVTKEKFDQNVMTLLDMHTGERNVKNITSKLLADFIN